MQNHLPKPDIFGEERLFSIRMNKVINYVKKNYRRRTPALLLSDRRVPVGRDNR